MRSRIKDSSHEMLHFNINMILQYDNGQPAFVKVANSVNLVYNLTFSFD